MHRRSFLTFLPGLAATSTGARAAASRPFTAYEEATGGRIGVYARNLVDGRTLSWRADARFVMCSTFKASLAGLVLARVDSGREALDESVRFGPADLLDYAPVARENIGKGRLSIDELCAGAVELSDNTCANLLLARVGGPAALTRFWRSVGDRVSRLDRNEPRLNLTPPGSLLDTTTPAAMAGTIRRLVLGRVLSSSSRERLTQWMIHCKTGARRLRAGLPQDWTIANKTGNNGEDAAGDIGIVWPRADMPVVICVYTRGGSPSPEQLQTAFAAIGKMVAQQLV